MSDEAKPPGSTDELGLVKFHIIAAVCWLIAGMLAGTFMGYRLSGAGAAEWLGDIELLSFGRIRILHTHMVVFGWLSNGFFAFSYYAIPRLTGRKLFARGIAKLNAPFVEVAVLLGGWIAVWALLARFHPQRQFWHDALAGTRLIDSRATAARAATGPRGVEGSR